MRLDTETIVRFYRELAVVLGEIPADTVKPIRERPGGVGRAQGGSAAASEPSREGLVHGGCVGRSGHGSGDQLARRRRRCCDLAWPPSCAASRPGGCTSATHSAGRATRSCAPCARHRPNAIRRSGRQSSRRGERIPLLRDGWTESGSEWLGTLRYDDGAATLRALGRVCCS